MAKLEFKYIYHSHTERCGHASGKDEEIVLAAIKSGVKVLCMTDHCPIPNHEQEGIRMRNDQLDEYIKTWTDLKNKYKNQIEIHIGLEVEYSIEHHDYLKDYVLNRGIEFYICGEHLYELNNELIWIGRSKINDKVRSREEIANEYVKQVLDGMNRGYIKYLAHPDNFIVKQGSFDKLVEDSARKIIETAIKNDVILELNVHGGYNHYFEEFGYPCIHFWKLVKDEYPEAKVTIGLDCHNIYEYIDNPALREILKIKDELGLNIIEKLDIEELKQKLGFSLSKAND